MKRADLNADGKVSTGEMERHLVDAIFDAADRNRDGSVNHAEWQKIFPDVTAEEFAKHDLGKTGSFTRAEGHAYCDRKGTFDKLVGKVDSSGDGIIDRAEAGAFKEKLRAAPGANSVQRLDHVLKS